ncbi:MAG: acyltransferase [Bacteroidales bacterium]|nr:acyltransferase [Bacteroidales bacterium]
MEEVKNTYIEEDIRPFTDEEAKVALAKVARHPMVGVLSKYLFPNEPVNTLRKMLKSIDSVDEFQSAIMSKAVEWVIKNTVDTFTYDGIENIQNVDGKFLAMSNHRDIILDPAFTQYVLWSNKLPLTEICVGDNLLSDPVVEGLLRSNRMIKVLRGISARELYLSSQVLSRYIRDTIVSGKSSVWIAQRQGRTKDGADITEQGLLKMFDMSGEKDFKSNFMELNIVPLCISYEYEPCDFKKAREILISRTEKYVKKKNEDMHSILTGIRQQKGHVHLHIGRPLTEEEIEMASHCDKNDRYQWIRHAADRRVIEGYKLWKTNYIAYDLVFGVNKYSMYYNDADVEAFKAYTEHKLKKAERGLDKDELRDIFWRIYANPIVSKENLF